MKSIGPIALRLHKLAAKKNVSLDELVRELSARFAVQRRPAIIRELPSGAPRRIRRRDEMPTGTFDVVATRDPFTSLALYLRDNFTLSEIDEL